LTAEFVLVGAGEPPAGERSKDPGAGHGHAHTAPDAAAVLRRLKLFKREVPIRPLIEGKWA
jgi:hypothetical protein